MSKRKPSAIAIIPARSGSKRVPGKNVRILDGHPLIAYSITSAVNSGVFSTVMVSTDSKHFADIASYYGAEVPFLRPEQFAGDTSPDIDMVTHSLTSLRKMGREYDCFSILRPTSPFRKPETIRRAWNEFLAADGIDSLRAVEKCTQHPCKMWIVRGKHMMPLIPFGPPEQPWHSSQYPTLPAVYVQNASLEIAWSRVVSETKTIAGELLLPFFTSGDEGIDVNNIHDWMVAEELVRTGEAILPCISQKPYMGNASHPR